MSVFKINLSLLSRNDIPARHDAFTSEANTIYGLTLLVLAPESKLLNQLNTQNQLYKWNPLAVPVKMS